MTTAPLAAPDITTINRIRRIRDAAKAHHAETSNPAFKLIELLTQEIVTAMERDQ